MTFKTKIMFSGLSSSTAVEMDLNYEDYLVVERLKEEMDKVKNDCSVEMEVESEWSK